MMCWKSSGEFILLNVIVFDLGSHSDHKGEATLWESSCMITPIITCIVLSTWWLMRNLKSRYLYHELASDSFCGQAVTGINPLNTEFSVSCCYFEADVDMNEKYISIWNMLLPMDTFNLLLCLSLLHFYCYSF